MSVDRTDVAKAHFLEQHAAVQERFDRVFELAQHVLGRLADDRQLVEQPGDVALEPVVKRRDAGLVEILSQAADAGADPHLVVVEDDQQVFFQAGRVVHRFEHDAGGQGPVAQDGHGAAVSSTGVAQQIVGRLEAEHGRNARAGVAGHEQVVGALVGIRVSHQAALGADRVELAEAAGQQLMRIDLVARVPDEAVFREIEDEVQGDGQFDHAQVAGEVGGARRNDAAQGFANLVGQSNQLLVRERPQVFRGLNSGKNLEIDQWSLSTTKRASASRCRFRSPKAATEQQACATSARARSRLSSTPKSDG